MRCFAVLTATDHPYVPCYALLHYQLSGNDTAAAMALFDDVAYGDLEQGSIYERSEANLLKVGRPSPGGRLGAARAAAHRGSAAGRTSTAWRTGLRAKSDQ
jgi:hypothetical protein